jgi:hypothetical protein
VIKDYDAGTPMECVISPLIRYLDLPVIIKRQREVRYTLCLAKPHHPSSC